MKETTPPPAPPPAGMRVTLDRREQVAEGTWAFHFGLGDALLPYVAGQAIDLTFPGARRPDPRGHVRPFSLAGAPGGTRITIATRIRQSPFKQELFDAPIGTPLQASDPWGDFTVPAGEMDVVFLAGGIGVTPFRAIVQDAIARSSPVEMSLIHSSRTPEETPFYDEFRRFSGSHTTLAYLPTMTQAERSAHPWHGERRRIDAAFLRDVLSDDLAAAFYMVAGPPGFVTGVSAALAEIGVPAGRVLLDSFDGY
jgi:ferredoxin-NADP reductase